MKWPALVLGLALVGCASATTRALPLRFASARSTGPAPARMIFDDEFEGNTLNGRIWSTCYPWVGFDGGCTNNPSLELEWYTKGNVSVADGRLNLIARARSAHAKLPYTSGMVSSGGWIERNGRQHPATIGFLYGYAEIRAKLPRGAGMWPAFWLVPTDGSWPPEIDIMEWQGVVPADDIVTVHWRDGSGRLQQSSTSVDVRRDLWAAFHTYAVDWEPDAITWYFDGRPIKRFTDARWIPHKPLYPILNLAIGGWLPGQLDPSASSFPATFAVDYLRIWNRKPR